VGAAHGARERAHHRRPDLAAVHRRRCPHARRGALDARRRAAVGRRGGARSGARRKARYPCLRSFPTPTLSLRDEAGSEALNPENLVCQAIRAIKKEFPDIGILCDVALDPLHQPRP
jgi:porphobilinogen synthase